MRVGTEGLSLADGTTATAMRARIGLYRSGRAFVLQR